MTKYEPICWVMFGGPSGIYLNMLTGVSVIAGRDYAGVIQFHYNNENVPMGCRKLGRSTPECAKTMHFEIDGPGGEFIDSFTVHIRRSALIEWFYKPGLFEALRVCRIHYALALPNMN